MMAEYRFRLIVSGPFEGPPSDEELLDATDALGVEFDRRHQSLQEAIAAAIRDVERAGYAVDSIEMDRDAVLPVGSN